MNRFKAVLLMVFLSATGCSNAPNVSYDIEPWRPEDDQHPISYVKYADSTQAQELAQRLYSSLSSRGFGRYDAKYLAASVIADDPEHGKLATHEDFDTLLASARMRGRLIVESSPPGATIIFHGHDLGTTKTAIWHEEGMCHLVVSKAGYEPETVACDVTAMKSQTVRVALKRR